MEKNYYFITRLLLGMAAFFVAVAFVLPTNQISDAPVHLLTTGLLIAVFLWFITQLYISYRPMIVRLSRNYAIRNADIKHFFSVILLGLGLFFPEQKVIAQANGRKRHLSPCFLVKKWQ